MEIQIGDKLEMQRGTMICTAPGIADAYVDGPDGKLVLKQTGVVLTEKMITAWTKIKENQAAYCGTRTSATL